jgi:hypothetical protein
MKSSNKSNYGCHSRCTTCATPLPSVGSTIGSTHRSNNREMARVAPIIFTPLHNIDIVEAEARVWMVYTVAAVKCHPHQRWRCVRRPDPRDIAQGRTATRQQCGGPMTLLVCAERVSCNCESFWHWSSTCGGRSATHAGTT